MSLSSIIGNALSGLQASQVGLQVSSNNVANVNTPGYARTIATFTSRNVGGQAMGVDVSGVQRVADLYLQAAALRASADAGAADVASQALDRFQSQVGGLDDEGSIFSRLHRAFNSINSASVEPALTVARLSAAADLQSFFDEAKRLSGELRSQRQETETRISATVSRMNEILIELQKLNRDVQSLAVNTSDTTGAANRQAELLDELSTYVDIRTQPLSDGRVVVRTGDGIPLLDNEAATLRYAPAGNGGYEANFAAIEIVSKTGGANIQLDSHIASGELRGLIDMRDSELPALAEELAELVAGATDALNAAHNNASAVPPPASLTGRNTGLLASDAHGFTGSTTLAVVDTAGTLVKRIDIDFTAGTYSVDGAAATAFSGGTIGDVVADINTALGGNGSASFTNGQLTISATGGDGIATLQDPAAPASRGGRGFAHFFGLNDIVDSARPQFFETGLAATDAHGFTAGQTLSFKVMAPDGRTAQNVSITVGGTSFNDLLTSLNDPVTGLGRYASFSLDGNGRLVETPVSGYANFDVQMTADSTSRGGTGLSFSQMFGVGLAAKANRAELANVRDAVRNDSSRLALAQLDISGTSTAGDLVLTNGDGRGGAALQQALTSTRTFRTAGGFSGGTSTLENYAARLAGDIGARSARAERSAQGAESLKQVAAEKRANVEGVSLDEELANMTLYQQSYNASARLLQAAKELTDTLLSLV